MICMYRKVPNIYIYIYIYTMYPNENRENKVIIDLIHIEKLSIISLFISLFLDTANIYYSKPLVLKSILNGN